MSEFIRNNIVYIVALLSLLFGIAIGKSKGRAEAFAQINNQRMREQAEKEMRERMAEMMRGFKDEAEKGFNRGEEVKNER